MGGSQTFSVKLVIHMKLRSVCFFPLSHILYGCVHVYGYVCYLLPVNIVYFMALLMSPYTQNILLQKVKVALKF